MAEININTNKNVRYLNSIFIIYSLILIIGYIISLMTTSILLDKYVDMVHTVMEMICICIALSTYFIVWHSYKETSSIYHLIGFGLLAVAIFDSFHAYYWTGARVLTQLYSDLQVKYWTIGRLVESLMLVAVSLRLVECRISKWIKLPFVLFLSIGLSLLIRCSPDIMPAMMTYDGLTSAKIALECVIISLIVFSLYNLRGKLKDENSISYKYIFLALLFIIPAELCFTLAKVVTNYHYMYGHILKIVYYYFLYKAVYVNCVEYPYKKLEEAYVKLEETNAKINEISSTLNDTLDALPIGVLNYECDRRLKYMNKRVEEIFCCDRQKLYGLSEEELVEIFPSVDKKEENIFNIAINGKKNPINLVRTYKNLKGEYVNLSVTAQSISNGVLIYLNEVKKEQEIKNFNVQTQTILNAASNCVLMTDQNEKIILYNEAFRKVFEINNIDIIGMSIDEFYNIVDFKIEEFPGHPQGGDEKDQPYNASFISFLGNRIELVMYANPIRNIENEVIGAISVYTDVTGIKKQQHNMQQQEKLAMIGQMAAGIVHEIKNPLATIKGLSQLITAKSKLDKVKEYSAVINSAIDDVTKVVNEFLSFAKPKPTVKIRTSINRVVESMQLITETQCYTKNIKSQFHYSNFPMEITADESKIRQVVLNITENAIAAMENVEHPELNISTYYDAEAKEGVIKVEDNGKGMSPDVIAKLGTPFFTTKEKGTGLGLGISSQIMKEHKGRIDVESEEGIGTIFKIIFFQIEDLI